MGLDVEEDVKRRPIELALAAGRKRQRKQTGFIHYCHESLSDVEHDTIPVVENSCFALALFRSRLADSVQEGKQLLEKLLAFEIGGNFPVYLHEYPHCRDSHLSIHLLPVLFWIERDFHLVLGDELLQHLRDAIERIRIYGLRIHQEHPLPKSLRAKLAVLEPSLTDDSWQPATPVEWGELLVAGQMAASLSLKPEKHLREALEAWAPGIHAFIGPNAHPLQERNEPAISLYDLFMSYYHRSFSKRLLQDHPMHLRAALIHPFLNTARPSTPASSFIFCAPSSKGNAFSLFWGDADHTHSLVCPYKKNQIRVQKESSSTELFIQLPEQLPDEGEGRMEIAFFCDIHPENQVFIGREKGTTFQLNEAVEIASKEIRIRMTFSLSEGEGIFFGHLSRTNRPGQRSCYGERIYEAYDWQIGLRTLRREADCTLHVKLEVITH